MTRRKLIKKNSILKLKYNFEERAVAEEENETGALELNEILKEFSERINPVQKKHFDNLFFGAQVDSKDSFKKSHTTDIVISDKKVAPNTINSNPANSPDWVKKLYKQIVQRSHPDRYIGFPIQEIKEKFTTVYINAVSAYEQQDIGMLLLCAYDVEIDINNVPESEQFINDSIEKQKQRIAEIINLIGYQWYHLVESNRIPFLEVYLSRLGYVFDNKKAEEAIKRKIKKRKVGSRPEKINRVKYKKIK